MQVVVVVVAGLIDVVVVVAIAVVIVVVAAMVVVDFVEEVNVSACSESAKLVQRKELKNLLKPKIYSFTIEN